jgi:hypothetical protein
MPTSTTVYLCIAGASLLAAIAVLIKCFRDVNRATRQYREEHDL